MPGHVGAHTHGQILAAHGRGPVTCGALVLGDLGVRENPLVHRRVNQVPDLPAEPLGERGGVGDHHDVVGRVVPQVPRHVQECNHDGLAETRRHRDRQAQGVRRHLGSVPVARVVDGHVVQHRFDMPVVGPLLERGVDLVAELEEVVPAPLDPALLLQGVELLHERDLLLQREFGDVAQDLLDLRGCQPLKHWHRPAWPPRPSHHRSQRAARAGARAGDLPARPRRQASG